MPDPALPEIEIRSWTEWTNDEEPGIEKPFQQCPDGDDITDMRWHQDWNGFCDVQIKCSGKGWFDPVTE